MPKFRVGPTARRTLLKVDRSWRQGQHVLVTGATGSGKTLLARQLLELRLRHGGFVIVLVAKMQADKTFSEEYAGWVRWERWKKRPRADERRVLLWPDTSGMTLREASDHLQEVFGEALDEFGKVGKWCLYVDEGLFTTAPSGLNLGYQIGLLSQLIRSAHGTLVLSAQRPSDLPLSVYANASHAFIGATNNSEDRKRLSNFARYDSRDLENLIKENGRHDFVYVPVATGGQPTRLNLGE